jgi:hypothetical protein
VDSYLNEFVFRYNRRFYRHVSFETLLGIASHRGPVSYWDIAGRENPRKGAPTVRTAPRRRKTAAGMRQDRVQTGGPPPIHREGGRSRLDRLQRLCDAHCRPSRKSA